MRRWARRLIDWVRDDLIARARARRGGLAVHVGYALGGQTRVESPVPWAADSVAVELVIHLPPAVRRKSDFGLALPGQGVVPAESIELDENGHHHVLFRFPVPAITTAGEILWKRHPLIPVVVPVLTAGTYLAGLTVQHPTVTVGLARHSVSARGFVARGCRGLTASAVLRASPTLAPVAELGLTVEFLNERTGRAYVTAVSLTAGQRFTGEALVSATCPRAPRRPGGWLVTWRAGEHVLAAERVEAIPADQFEGGVRLLETRFAVADHTGPPRLLRVPPAPGAFPRVGPCFVLTGTEPGMAGLCRLSLFAVVPGVPSPAKLLDEVVLVGDAPTVFAPGLVESSDLARISAFELRLNGRLLGTATLASVPPAALTAEGGFKPPPDFTWTPAAEEELLDRLGRLGGL